MYDNPKSIEKITNNRLFDDKERIDMYLKIVLSLVVFLTGIRHLNDVYQPTLLDDEYSYWSIAAYFNGRDWSSVTSLCKYYSYGYSFILYFLMKIFNNTVLMYRCAIVINAVFLTKSFLILVKILKKIFSSENINRITLVSFVSIMIPCYLSFVTVNLTECLLLLLFLKTIYLLQEVGENTTSYDFFLISVVLGYSYMVHQRMICVIIGVAVYFIILVIKKVVKIWQLLIPSVVLIMFFMAHHVMKEAIKVNLWLSGEMSSDNDYESIFENIRFITGSIKQMAVFIIGIMGKLFYFGSATYILGFVAIVLIIIGTFRACREYSEKTIYVILSVSFVLMMIVSAVFMCRNEKLAWLVYGRYAEFLYPLIIALGYFEIKSLIQGSIKKYVILYLSGGGIYVVMGMIIRWYSKRRGLNWINYISCNQIFKYTSGDNLPILKMMFIVGIIGSAVAALLVVKKYRVICEAVLLTSAIVMAFYTSEYSLNEVNLKLQKSKYESSSCVEWIEENITPSGRVFFYISKDEENETAQYREYLQYWMQNKRVICTDDENLYKISKGDIFVISCEDYKDVADAYGRCMYSNEFCHIYVWK